jgi:TonB family protein
MVLSLRRTFVGSVVTVMLSARVADAQDPLAAARDLYAAAAYEDALARLDSLRSSTHSAEEDPVIEQYRAYCLLALGRSGDAERAIEAVVTAAPSYRPSDADMSPRIRAAFHDVRRRVLPDIILHRFDEAKAAFDRKDAAAADGFNQVLALLADSDIGPAASQPPLSSVRTLAAGFLDLSTKAAALPATVAPVPQVALPPPLAIAPRPAASRIYGTEDTNVVPAVVVRQSLPIVNDALAARQGIVEIIIDETGSVEAATIRMSVNPVYDRLVLATTKNWRYRPATLDGAPVKFRKIIQLDLKSR